MPEKMPPKSLTEFEIRVLHRGINALQSVVSEIYKHNNIKFYEGKDFVISVSENISLYDLNGYLAHLSLGCFALEEVFENDKSEAGKEPV